MWRVATLISNGAINPWDMTLDDLDQAAYEADRIHRRMNPFGDGHPDDKRPWVERRPGGIYRRTDRPPATPLSNTP